MISLEHLMKFDIACRHSYCRVPEQKSAKASYKITVDSVMNSVLKTVRHSLQIMNRKN